MTQARRDGGRHEALLARRGGWVECLRLPAMLFGMVARSRRALYDRGLLPSSKVDVVVVSVGNLSVGGTGKTPFVAWLAREFARRGRRVGLLSRGYGSHAADDPGGRNEEALELERALGPDALQVQNPDRVAGALALQRAGAEVIVLDDGFQHRRLKRDLDLVLVDATRPFGLPPAHPGEAPIEALLPRGFLREPASALRRADACILTRVDQVSQAELGRLAARLDDAAPGVPLLLARHAPRRLSDLAGGPRALEDLHGARIAALSAIGNFEAFRRTLEALGAKVVEEQAKRDHARYDDEDARFVAAFVGAGEGRRVVTTAKDAPKLKPALPPALHERVLVLEVEFELLLGLGVLTALLDALPWEQGAAPRRLERPRG